MTLERRNISVFTVKTVKSRPNIKPQIATFVYLLTPYWLMILLNGMLTEIEEMKKIMVIQLRVETVIPNSEDIFGNRTTLTLVTMLVDN